MSTGLEELLGQAQEFGVGDISGIAGGQGGLSELLAEIGFSGDARGIALQLGVPENNITDELLSEIQQLLTSAESSLGDIPGLGQELLGQVFAERRTAGETALGARDIRLGEASRGFAGGQRALQANALQQAEAIRTRGAASGFAGGGAGGQAASRFRRAGSEASQDLFGSLTAQRGAAQTQFGSTIAGLQTGLQGQVGAIGRTVAGEREDVLTLLGGGLQGILETLRLTEVSEGLDLGATGGNPLNIDLSGFDLSNLGSLGPITGVSPTTTPDTDSDPIRLPGSGNRGL